MTLYSIPSPKLHCNETADSLTISARGQIFACEATLYLQFITLAGLIYTICLTKMIANFLIEWAKGSKLNSYFCHI